jgi:hypothetical protein
MKLAIWLCAGLQLAASEPYRFAVIGDSGSGGKGSHEVGERLAEARVKQGFDTVLMLGDNIYGRGSAKDFRSKFEEPFAKLLGAGVRFYAALGNHDSPRQLEYEGFHMGGRSYYSFAPHPDFRFFAVDSNRLDAAQLEWLDRELKAADCAWKVVYFHHPLYSSGKRHGSSMALRKALEPLLVRHGVAVALAGHDHFYERIKPQQGVHHFVVGAASKVRTGNARRSEISASAFDRDHSFLVMEADGRTLRFRAISRTGKVVDEGAIER